MSAPEFGKAIKGLECCMLSYKDGCDECPYIGKGMCQELLGEHAIALLKAQEPRVMDVDEVRKWVGKQRVDREPICVEVKDNICAWIVSDEYWDISMDINLSSDLYGKTWRCWTSRPTDAQREATAWEQ